MRITMIAATAAALCLPRATRAQAVPPPTSADAPADTVMRGAVRAPQGRKSPVVAGLLGFVVPGAGHFYAGEAARGGITLATYVGAAAVISDGPDALWQAGGVALLGAWVFGVVDGTQAARRHNAERRTAAAHRAPLRLTAVPTVRGLRIGLQLQGVMTDLR